MTNRSLFYGWWIVAAFSVTTFMSTGVRHAVGPFLKPIVADLGIDRASFSIVIAPVSYTHLTLPTIYSV